MTAHGSNICKIRANLIKVVFSMGWKIRTGCPNLTVKHTDTFQRSPRPRKISTAKFPPMWKSRLHIIGSLEPAGPFVRPPRDHTVNIRKRNVAISAPATTVQARISIRHITPDPARPWTPARSWTKTAARWQLQPTRPIRCRIAPSYRDGRTTGRGRPRPKPEARHTP